MTLLSNPNEVGLAPSDDAWSNWIQGFGNSTLATLPELIGIDASEGVQQWRQDNPIGSFFSQNITPIGEFGAAARLGKLALRSSEALRALSEVRPIAGGVATHVAGMGGVSAARIAGALVSGGNWAQVAQSSLVDTAMDAAFGGIGGAVKAAGEPAPKAPFGAFDMTASMQTNGRKLKDMLENNQIPAEHVPNAQQWLAKWSQGIRAETDPRQGRPFLGYVERPLTKQLGDMAAPAGADHKDLNKLFTIGRNPAEEQPAVALDPNAPPVAATIKKRLTAAQEDFVTEQGRAKAEADMQLPRGYEFYGQNFRQISFGTEEAAGKTAHIVQNNMLDIGNGWYLAKEQDPRLMHGAVKDEGGLYVMAKKVEGPQLKAGLPMGHPDDKWLVFKTDTPEFFAAEGGKFNDPVSKFSWDRAEDADMKAKQDAQPFFHLVNGMNSDIPAMSVRTDSQGLLGMGKNWTPGAAVDFTSQALSKGLGWGDAGAAPDIMKRAITEYFAPAMRQFQNNPMAVKAFGIMKAIFGKADAESAALISGEQSVPEGNLWKAALQKGASKDSIEGLVKAMTPEEFDQLNAVLRDPDMKMLEPARLPPGIVPAVRNVLGKIQDVNNKVFFGLKTAEDAAGIADGEGLAHKAGHLGLSHTWLGGFRIPVRNESGDLVAIASGRTPGPAQKMAKAMVAEAAASGKKWKVDLHEKLHHEDDIHTEAAIGRRTPEEKAIVKRVYSVGKPGFYAGQNPDNIGGYIGEKDFSKKELIDKLKEGVLVRMRRQAQLAYEQGLDPLLQTIAREDPNISKQLQERLDLNMGKSTKFGKWQNDVADKFLAPYLGHGSATKIARALSGAIFALRYGFGALALPVMSIMNFLQTHFPELAMLKDGAPEFIARNYGEHILLARDGTPKGSMGALDMAKLQGAALSGMKNPEEDFRRIFIDGVNRGTMDPTMVQEFLGSEATVRDHFKAFKEDKGLAKGWAFWKYVQALGAWPAKTVERLSRAQTYSLAYQVGTKFLGLSSKLGEDHALQDFMEKFTNRTMFSYGTADRSKVFQGPLGSTLGLTKNWMMHYLFNIMDYIGEAGRGNIRPLMYAAAMPMLAGGVGATGGLYYIADKLSRMYGNKPLMERIYESFGNPDDPSKPTMADLIWQGLPGYLPKLVGAPGISLTQSLALPMADPAGEINWMATPALYDQGKLLVKALADMKLGYDATGGPTPEAWAQVARAVLPKTFYRGMNAANTGMINSATTLEPEMTNLTPMERFMYTMGINPSRVANYYTIKSDLQNEQANLKALVSKMGQQWALARDSNDSEMMKRIMTKAMVKGMDIRAIMRSAKGFSKRFNENGLTAGFNKARAQGWQRITGVNQPMPNQDLADATL